VNMLIAPDVYVKTNCHISIIYLFG